MTQRPLLIIYIVLTFHWSSLIIIDLDITFEQKYTVYSIESQFDLCSER